MAKIPTQIRIDEVVKRDATKLFKTLGLDMSSAVNIFLHQCILQGGLPFNVEIPNYNKRTMATIEQAGQMVHEESAEYYTDMNEMKKSLLKDREGKDE